MYAHFAIAIVVAYAFLSVICSHFCFICFISFWATLTKRLTNSIFGNYLFASRTVANSTTNAHKHTFGRHERTRTPKMNIHASLSNGKSAESVQYIQLRARLCKIIARHRYHRQQHTFRVSQFYICIQMFTWIYSQQSNFIHQSWWAFRP